MKDNWQSTTFDIPGHTDMELREQVRFDVMSQASACGVLQLKTTNFTTKKLEYRLSWADTSKDDAEKIYSVAGKEQQLITLAYQKRLTVSWRYLS